MGPPRMGGSPPWWQRPPYLVDAQRLQRLQWLKLLDLLLLLLYGQLLPAVAMQRLTECLKPKAI